MSTKLKVTIEGIGGSGKTTLAAFFVKKLAQLDDSVEIIVDDAGIDQDQFTRLARVAEQRLVDLLDRHDGLEVTFTEKQS